MQQEARQVSRRLPGDLGRILRYVGRCFDASQAFHFRKPNKISSINVAPLHIAQPLPARVPQSTLIFYSSLCKPEKKNIQSSK